MGFNSYQRMLAVRTWLRRNKFKKVEPFKKWKILTGDKVRRMLPGPLRAAKLALIRHASLPACDTTMGRRWRLLAAEGISASKA